MAQIIYADGTSKDVQPANGRGFTLKEAQAIVGGLVEVIELRDNRLMIVNKESLLLDLPRNEQATTLAELPSAMDRLRMKEEMEAAGVCVIMGDDFYGPGTRDPYIAGDVLVCDERELR